MQDLIIKNVKNDDYKKINLNEFHDPNGTHKRTFEFLRSDVVSPYRCG